ncbi:hypothetical protein C8R45DRAFT_947069 [Mycena sanguinolenta]|nr:hypothetical protein C8R45DRAFT_947069 [Mycena sanguinolenta]
MNWAENLKNTSNVDEEVAVAYQIGAHQWLCVMWHYTPARKFGPMEAFPRLKPRKTLFYAHQYSAQFRPGHAVQPISPKALGGYKVINYIRPLSILAKNLPRGSFNIEKCIQRSKESKEFKFLSCSPRLRHVKAVVRMRIAPRIIKFGQGELYKQACALKVDHGAKRPARARLKSITGPKAPRKHRQKATAFWLWYQGQGQAKTLAWAGFQPGLAVSQARARPKSRGFYRRRTNQHGAIGALSRRKQLILTAVGDAGNYDSGRDSPKPDTATHKKQHTLQYFMLSDTLCPLEVVQQNFRHTELQTDLTRRTALGTYHLQTISDKNTIMIRTGDSIFPIQIERFCQHPSVRVRGRKKIESVEPQIAVNAYSGAAKMPVVEIESMTPHTTEG